MSTGSTLQRKLERSRAVSFKTYPQTPEERKNLRNIAKRKRQIAAGVRTAHEASRKKAKAKRRRIKIWGKE